MNYSKFFRVRNAPVGTSQGYPVPGPQQSNAEEIARNAFFAIPCSWANIISSAYDFIVIGTGATGVAFIDQALQNNPNARILVLERGGFWLPVHYQMLPLAFQNTSASPPTTYPWSRTSRMATTPPEFFQAGYIPFAGGRTSYWSAWCPSPGPNLMRDWPEDLIATTRRPGFWERAKKFLHVTTMDQINDGVYGNLQRQLDENLARNFKALVPSAEAAYPAPIAVANPEWKTVKFYKFSTLGRLLELVETQKDLASRGGGSLLTIADQCIVERLLHDNEGTITAIETSRGTIPVGSANIILAMGSIPPATLLMNSFGERIPNAGKRYTGHFMSHVTARVKRSAFTDLSALEIGATYLEGKDKAGHQYHVQSSAFASGNPIGDQVTVAHECPDAAAAPTLAQLIGSEDHVVFVCATLGEANEKNPSNKIELNSGRDLTTNISLEFTPDEMDRNLWDVLDAATYQTIEAMVTSAGGNDPEIEYWVEAANGTPEWSTSKPPQSQIRLNIIVHEASHLWMGNDPKTSVVGLDYRPHGVANVFLTGASLFPTSGSWNPTLTMCGLAQHLADKLTT